VGHVRDDRDIEIRIEDDGLGFDPAQVRTGRGLTDMRARAERIGAGFDVTSLPGKGTVVRLTIPRAAPARAFDPAATEVELVPMLRPVPATQIV
jgi:nitrate/nitrite-specific signal transduction histidine kinase